MKGIENQDDRHGVSIGNFINIKFDNNLVGRFENFVINEPLFMHEYGHTSDSRLFGPLYLPGIGLPSANDAEWTEVRANRAAWRYADRYNFMINWLYPVDFPLN